MLHVGTCGYSYKDWIGPFYPPGTKSGEMLGLYARRFATVEIDSTYYAIPRPSLFESMVRRTPSDFRFAVKAPGSVTHAPVDGDPPSADLIAFREAVEPLVAAGRLGAVLAQFPHAFVPDGDAWRRIMLLRERWSGLPIVAEFRHREWQRPGTLRELRRMDIGWCNVDEPRLSTLMRPGAQATSEIGYVRFHGRNASTWWRQDRSPDERYDYLYREAELTEWLPRIAQIDAETRETFVFFNNHRNGQAATNARQMAHLLGLGGRDDEGDIHDQLPLIDDGASRPSQKD
jgi:uncharacterized protein YecE (DUF72 family)